MDLETILGLDPKSLRDRTERTIEAIYDEWKALAPNQRYADALMLEMTSDTSGRVTLEGPSVFAERGVLPRDMKEPILASPKAHRSKTGARYMAVPMKNAQNGSGFVTASDNGKPWMSKGRTGVGAIKRVRAMVPGLVQFFWSSRSP